MIKIITLMLFSCIPAALFAQEKWGYSVAQVKYPSNDTLSTVVFISNVVNLSTLNCASEKNASNEKDKLNKVFDKCICDWFYNRVIETDGKVRPYLDKADVIGDVELYSEFKGGKNERFMGVPDEKREVVFMDKETANKKRSNFIELAEKISSKTNSKIILID
jgi:hypothetical protein